MTTNIALVGIGKIARDQHIPAIGKSTGFTLSATASRSARVEGIASYTSLEQLLDAERDVSAVSLCTPPQVRYTDARCAIAAGRHVMLEKPPGATLAEVRDLAARARSAGVTLFASWHAREAAAVDAARAWLADRTIHAVQITWEEDVRVWHPGQDWIWAPGGLGVFDPGINALSVMTTILPGAVHLAEAELAFPANRATPIAATLQFSSDFAADISASFDWRRTGRPAWTITLDTSDGEAVLSEGGARFTVAGRDVIGGEDEEYQRLYARFADLIATGSSDVDDSPLVHVADAFMIGKRRTIDPFEW
ncbi:MAG: Gfo/Idh/MocA family oxidoreductase [Pseudomonadota bacterium]